MPNLYFRGDDNSIKKTNMLDLSYLWNTLPSPDRTIHDIEKYYSWSPEAILRSSMGCLGNCAFCSKTKFYPFRTKTMTRFFDEIEELMRLGFKRFFFSDETFAFSDQRLIAFQDEYDKRKLRFDYTSNIRISDINEFKLSILKNTGAYRVFTGVETLDAENSKIINKSNTFTKIKNAIDLIKKYDIEVHVSFILGCPGDTVETYKYTEEMIHLLNPTMVSFNMLQPMPGTDIYTNPNKYGILMEDRFWFERDDWTKEPVSYTRELSKNDILYWKKRLNKSFVLGRNHERG